LDKGLAERESETVRRMLKFERRVREQIQKLKEQLDETRLPHLRLTPDNIEAVVKIGLELAQQLTSNLKLSVLSLLDYTLVRLLSY
jgi:predicted aspartyl protease